MDRISKVTAFKTADGKLHEDAESARQSVLEALVREAAKKEISTGGELCRQDLENFFLLQFDPVRKELDRIMGTLRV